MSEGATGRVSDAVSRTRDATALTLRRRDARLVVAGVTVVENPIGNFLRPELGPLSFTPVAVVALGPVTYLLSFNTVLGLGLSTLVGLNLGLTYLAWTQPKACGIGQSSTGILASLPAVLSGTACCGPVVLIVLGIQASGVLLTAFQFLLPVAVLLLLGSLVLVGRQIRPDAV